ncbi:MAG: hypothetical protein JO257_25245 [Deltaproteobacteria bacterium]|nr:hypothetical protein [Deltaproteobacteria bacterium]
MKKAAKKKLEVNAQTVRVLSTELAATVAGGLRYPCSGVASGCGLTNTCPPNTTNGCTVGC